MLDDKLKPLLSNPYAWQALCDYIDAELAGIYSNMDGATGDMIYKLVGRKIQLEKMRKLRDQWQ